MDHRVIWNEKGLDLPPMVEGGRLKWDTPDGNWHLAGGFLRQRVPLLGYFLLERLDAGEPWDGRRWRCRGLTGRAP